ncbi:uncharacterized protein LOC135503245 [Lineus longissimus]|uniref:uncharacterized protein LOC135503245 n=1 Tax=Lineus longissimus TaxID=88925 RepID=UPI00315D3C4D
MGFGLPIVLKCQALNLNGRKGILLRMLTGSKDKRKVGRRCVGKWENIVHHVQFVSHVRRQLLSDASKSRASLRKRLEKERKQLQHCVTLYNSKADCHVSVDEVTQEDSLLPWHNPAGNKGETFALKKKIVDIHEHMTRYIEELPVLIQEIVSTVLFFKKKINTLEDRINTVNNEAIKNQENHGLVKLLLESKEFYTDLLLEATDVFECIDTDIEIVVDFEEGEVQPGGEESNSEEDASSSEEEDCDDIGIEYV